MRKEKPIILFATRETVHMTLNKLPYQDRGLNTLNVLDTFTGDAFAVLDRSRLEAEKQRIEAILAKQKTRPGTAQLRGRLFLVRELLYGKAPVANN